ncbi:asparagine synthase (glutamine-hydrolyzing) [Nonomuraea sp. NPDC050328]|uniref:asparagine synthase (glutamine-hydrolyzing) n=1 Tax=Nonomuraea sp. NPDC050328 TaxID=3364361 RepID=UPI0037A14674
MCAISGLVTKGRVDVDRIRAMNRAQSRRGPDGSDTWTSACGRLGLGMNLLAIVDGDAQAGPYGDPVSGARITFNGEIYNHRELARQWGITLAPGQTDAHLVLEAYLRFGPACLELFDGMFAFAVFDPRDGTVFLARDRFGEKPLYYHVDQEEFSFASEVKGIEAITRLTPKFSQEWLAVESPLGADTPYSDVYIVEAGSYLIVELASLRCTHRQWWSIAAKVNEYPSYVQAYEQAGSALVRTARRRIFSGDSGLLLSGGLDSAVLAMLLRPQVLLTARYPGAPRYDEYDLAKKVADAIGAELVVVEPQVSDFQNRAAEIVEDLDYPVGNASLLSEHLLYRAAARLGLRVVHGGIGPDEFLLGYVRNSIALDGPSITDASDLRSYEPLGQKFREEDKGTSPADRYYRMCLRGPDLTAKTRNLVYECFDRGADLGQAISLVELSVSMPAMLLTSDKLASAYGIERRSPYLAHEWAELCFQLPLEYKRRSGYSKRVLRDFARDIGVPQEIWANVDKRGFASPVPGWLATTLDGWYHASVSPLEDAGTPALAQRIKRLGAASVGHLGRSRLQALLISMWWQRVSAGHA